MGWADKARSGPVREITDAPPIFLDEMSPEEITKNIGTGKTRVWSDEQKKIFHWFKTSKIGRKVWKNLVVIARAGTGKTTTIIEALSYLDPGLMVLLAAFNKRIAVELEGRVNHPNATVKTLHAIGFSIIREWWRGVRVAKGDDRARALAILACGEDTPDTILKLVAKLHTKAREITPFALREDDGGVEALETLAEQFECDPEYFWQAQGYDVHYIVSMALKCLEIATEDVKCTGNIDFADMIFLPLVKWWTMRMFDVGVVDEAQDMTVAQLMLFLAVIKEDGRICVIGDDKQAIYTFRGADSGSLGRLLHELKAGLLGLTVTYRCGKRIVEEARQFVDDFYAADGNSEGTVQTIVREQMLDKVQYGDFILSRLNAPLAGYAMQLLREQRRARIAGRDIGQSIKNSLRKFTKGARTIDDVLEGIDTWATKQRTRFTRLKWEAKLAELEDTVETMQELVNGCDAPSQIEPLIDKLFSDDGLGDKGLVTLSSVHKAKGLEADRVYVLGWTLRTGKSQEEDNIHYVAITRARDVLTMVQ